MLEAIALKEKLESVLKGESLDLINDEFEGTKARRGAIFNEALKCDDFQPETAYLMLSGRVVSDLDRVFVGSDGHIIGRAYDGRDSEQFTLGHHPDSDLYKIAVKVANGLGQDLKANDHLYDQNDYRHSVQQELGVTKFEDWVKVKLADYTNTFPNIELDDLVEVLDSSDMYFQEAIRDLIVEDKYAVGLEKEDFIEEIKNAAKALYEISKHEDFEKMEAAFNVDVGAMLYLDLDDLEEELDEAFPVQEVKSKNKLKP